MTRSENVLILNRDNTVATLTCCIQFTLIQSWQWASVIIIMINSVRGRAYATSGTKPSSEEFVQFDDVPLGRQSPITVSFRTQYTSFSCKCIKGQLETINVMYHLNKVVLFSSYSFFFSKPYAVAVWMIHMPLIKQDDARGGEWQRRRSAPPWAAETGGEVVIVSAHTRSIRPARFYYFDYAAVNEINRDVWTQCGAKWATTLHVFHHYTQWLWIKLWEEKKNVCKSISACSTCQQW